jgi:hypothetical protein
MFFEMLIGMPAAPVALYAWPRDNTLVVNNSPTPPFLEVYPSDNTWLTFKLGTAGCTDGVSLAYDDVGTLNNPSSWINLNSPNTMVARPEYKTSGVLPTPTPIPPNTISATFKIADWGSVWGPAAWNPIDSSGGNGVGQLTATLNAGSKGEIDYPWTLSAAERAPFLNGTYITQDQCMLVELSGANINFINSSVTRNMDFVNASSFKRDAIINIKGTGPMPSGTPKRDVYLYVEKLNMPATISGGQTNAGYPGMADVPVERQRSQLKELASKQGRLESVFPTYRVHVYHDTGQTIRIQGVAHPVLEPQSSFGYYVSHSGTLYGWDTSLQGAQKIAENFYKIPIPIDGKAKITTTIRAKGCCMKLTTTGTALGAVGIGLLGIVVYLPGKRRV